VLSRRAVLKRAVTVGVLGALHPSLAARSSQAAPRADRAAILDYLHRHARGDGGYAFEDQERSHLTPTFAAIGAFHLLGAVPQNTRALAQYVRTHHPSALKRLEQEHRCFELQQVQALAWLGDDAADFRDRIAALRAPLAYMKQYEQHGYPVLQSELAVVQCHALLGLPLEPLIPTFPAYIAARRRSNGSYNNTPASEGGDGHVMNTLWALQALRVFGAPVTMKREAIAWLRGCQLPGGGFTFQPNPSFGGVDDVAYTRAAVQALRELGSDPAEREACVRYLLSLATADGGFSDRPDWSSHIVATYCALDALDALGSLDRLSAIRRPSPRRQPALPAGLEVYSMQIEAHGTGSPAEAVALAAGLRIDLWGSKNAEPGWIERAQAVADARRVPLKFFRAD
jgi:prenyltransferase beta subunit